MNSFLDDTDAIDPTAVETAGALYPAAQWFNGDPKLAAVGGVAHTGGVILSSKYVDDGLAPAPGWTWATVAFSTGKSEKVLAAQKPRLAVVRTRFRWVVTYNGVRTYYPRSGYIADSGMRGHLQALCGVHGFDFPVTITFKGKSGQAFELLLREFTEKVMQAATKAARAKDPKATARFPRFAFYLKLAPQPHQKVGQKGQESVITPPALELPSVLSDEYLGKIYVGRETLLGLQQLYHDSAEWGAAWDKPGAEEDAGEAPAEAHEAAGRVDPVTGEVVDILTEAQALTALRAHKIDQSVLRQALQAAHGSFQYDPERDTTIVRMILANKSEDIPF